MLIEEWGKRKFYIKMECGEFMANDREIDSRAKNFGHYLAEQISAQLQRPYRQKEDIERKLVVYETVREAYRSMLQLRDFPVEIYRELYDKPIVDLELS